MSRFICTSEDARVYKLRPNPAEKKRSFGWADAYVRYWPGGVALSVQSDFGSYAYTWTAIGPGPWQSFLIHLDFDYFMGKCRPGYLKFDQEKTLRSIRASIVERRRDEWGGLTREAARECWDDLALYGDDDIRSEEHFYSEIMRSPALSKFFDGEYDFISKSPSSDAVGFWKELWPALCEHWRAEITSGPQAPEIVQAAE